MNTQDAMTTIRLKPGKEKSLHRLHPWVFSGALARIPRNLAIGQTVELVSGNGEFLARGALSPHSQIAFRAWTFDAGEPVDAEFFHSRLQQALNKREGIRADFPTTALRLVNAESDGLPGLVLDQYDGYLVLQCLGAGAEFWKQVIVDQLLQLLPHHSIYERSDVDIRLKEGLAPTKGVLAGSPPPELVEIKEGPLLFLVDIVNGHKTGFYLDQRENRRHIQAYTSGAEVLNCFAYSGGFGLSALAGGASHLTNVEISAQVIGLLEKNLARNDLASSCVETIQGDVFAVLRGFRNEERRFDLIVLDPPRFADSRAQLKKALRGYKDINWLAFRLLRPGGTLVTFSCSGLLDAALFQKVVADAALDAGRKAQLLQRLGQAMDHPVLLSFPEGSYLKGLVCRVD